MKTHYRIPVAFMVAGAVIACGGCATAPLGGTKWDVVELHYAGDDPGYQDMTVEFTQDGRLITTAVKNDGTRTVDARERYSVDRDHNIITIKHPEYKLMCMYRFEGDQLRVHSERFIVRMDPIKDAAAK